jgi:hypothetical protein
VKVERLVDIQEAELVSMLKEKKLEQEEKVATS